MNTSLLATKIRIPPPGGRPVPRTRLENALTQGVMAHPLTLVSAPAGYGKTTLLRQWASDPPAPVAWYSIEEADNERVRFLRYLVAAWEPVRPEIAESPLGLLLGSSDPDLDSVLTAWLDLGYGRRDPVILVLDDFHLIVDSAIHRDMAFLLDHLPEQVHFVIAGRDEPPLPLARYRARRQLFELRTEDLRFQIAEASAFFQKHGGQDISHETMAAITDQLEGWAAGLQLLSLGPVRNLTGGEVPLITGRHRFIGDYLREEVLARLPEDRRRFMMQTSILDRLCGSLCDTVTASTGGQAMLESLERANLFIAPLDDDREWFRFHRLFADVLRAELDRSGTGSVATLHCRAARWYFARRLPEPALHHAIAGRDIETARSVFALHAMEYINTGAVRAVRGWLDALPDEWIELDASFGLARAGCLMAEGTFAQGVRCIDDVEERLTATADDDRTEQLARVHAVRCFVACAQNDLPAAVSLAERALRDLPGADRMFRIGVHLALGDSYRRNGRWDEARAAYLRVLELDHGRMSAIRAVRANGALADLELRRGRLQDAGRFWRESLRAMDDRETWGRLPLDVSGWVLLRYAELLYEWDDLDSARRYLDRGLARADLGGDALSLIAGHLIAARVHLTEGDVAAAAGRLEWVRPLVAQSSYPDWNSRFDRCQVDVWLRQARLRSAVDWAHAMLQSEAFAGRPENEPARLALARVLLLDNDLAAQIQARSVLDALLDAAEAEGRAGARIEALALVALAHWRHVDIAPALSALERALRLAEPEGYIRLFADLGLPMARLLQEARARGVLPDYVARILTAFHEHLAGPGEVMPETLSEREGDVLRLVAGGLTNREIADALFISRETVKKHNGAIFGKLGVSNRTEAAARARALGLLSD